MDEFLEVDSDTDDNSAAFPEIFLKIRRPDVYSKLEAERQLLYRVTEELPGARSYLLQSYIEKTILECDFEQEQMYLELGYEKYNGKANGRIFVPRVIARPLGEMKNHNKSHNSNFNVGRASVTGVANGLNDPGVLILEMAPGRPFDRLLAEQQGMPEKNQPLIDWNLAVNTYLDCFDLWLAVALEKSQRHTFFHGDPHLGNLFWCDESKRFSLIDFGNSYEIFGKDYPSGISGCFYEFMQGGILLKPERIFRVFPFREDVPESQREYLANRVVTVAKQAFDEYFEMQLAQDGNKPEEDRPPSATEDVTKQVEVCEEGNLSECVFARTYFEIVAHRHLMDPHPAFEGFMKCLAMHWVGGFKMIVAGLQESIPEGCRVKRPNGSEELVPWDKAFRSPFPIVEARITAAISKAKGAQDTWDLYMMQDDKNKKNLLWKYHIVPHMTNYAPKTLETLRMMHRGFTGVRAVFGRAKG